MDFPILHRRYRSSNLRRPNREFLFVPGIPSADQTSISEWELLLDRHFGICRRNADIHLLWAAS